MKPLLKNIKESCNKEEKQEEDNLNYTLYRNTNFIISIFKWLKTNNITI